MKTKNCRFVRLSDNIEIPVPTECTREEEQEFIARFKSEHDLAELEKDYRQLAQQIGGGNLVPEPTFPLEELIDELQETQKQLDQRSA